MIVNYKDDQIHTKHMDYTIERGTPDKIYNAKGNSFTNTKGISLADLYGTTQLSSDIETGCSYGSIIRINSPCGSTTEIFIPSISSGMATNYKNEQPNFYIRSRNDMHAVNGYDFSKWRKVAFVDEINQTECPFPVGFSFMANDKDRSNIVSSLRDKYPKTDWKYDLTTSLGFTSIKRTK